MANDINRFLVKRSNYLLIHLSNNDIVCTELCSSEKYIIDITVLKILQFSVDWVYLNDIAINIGLSLHQCKIIIDKLLKINLLITNKNKYFSYEIDFSKEWSFIDFVFHRLNLYKTHLKSKKEFLIGKHEQTIVTAPIKVILARKNISTCLRKRRSIRSFSTTPIHLNVLYTLLYYSAYSYGKFSEVEANKYSTGLCYDIDTLNGARKFPYPIAGAINTLEIFIFSNNILGYENTILQYNYIDNNFICNNNFNYLEICKFVFDDLVWIKNASCILVITSKVFKSVKYNNSYKLTLLETGHLLQNLLLISTSLDISSCEFVSFNEDAFLNILRKMKYENVPIAAVAIGNKIKEK